MRFNCQSCAAKYQIADEKVAGKTIRMKCRKCDAVITVRAKQGPEGLAVVVAPGGTAEPTSARQPEMGASDDAMAPLSALPGASPSPSLALSPLAPSPLAASPLAASPLGALPLAASPLAPSPLGSTPLAPSPLGSTPLPLTPLIGGAAFPARPPRRPGAPLAGATGVPRPPSSAATMVGQAPSRLVGRAAAGSQERERGVGTEEEATQIMRRPSAAEIRSMIAKSGGGTPGLSDGSPDDAGTAGSISAAALAAAAAIAPAAVAAAIAQTATAPTPAAAPIPDAADAAAEWFVGIDGTPVGPVPRERLTEFVAAGKIDGASLVWKESLADWMPLAQLDELADVLAAGKVAAGSAWRVPSGGAAPPAEFSEPVVLTRLKSLSTGAGDAAGAVAGSAGGAADPLGGFESALAASVPLAAPAATGALAARAAATAPIAATAPAAVSEAAAKSTQAASASAPIDSAAAKKAAEIASIGGAVHGLSATLDSKPFGQAAPQLVSEPAASIRALSADAAPPSARVSLLPSDAEMSAMFGRDRRHRSRGMHPAAWALIAMAAGFGAVAAYALLMPKPLPQADGNGLSAAGSATAKTAPAAGPSAAASSDETHAPVELGAVELAGGAGAAKPVVAATSTGAGKLPDDGGAKAGAGAADKPCDPSDPFCQTVSGPKSAGPNDTGAAGATGLTPEQVQSVVSKNSKGVGRSCAGMANGERVSVAITVGASGTVQSARASGGGGNSGLVNCVTGKVRGWKFPASGGTTTINAPFVFVSQN
ncbi:MAG: DUF4339 domain-containing protein [Myxococcales bacterium]|nr:DUF4339 domain-containing protein [Myxococcales bacterium]